MRFKYSTLQYLDNLAPVLIMASISLFSIFLVKKSAPTLISEVSQTAPNQYNYYLKQFFISGFYSTGHLKMYVSGDSALHFEQPAQMSVKNFNVYYTNHQIKYQANAKSALIDEGSESIKLFDNVKILRSQHNANQ
jgi:LPS export ABC transporter protein LptC